MNRRQMMLSSVALPGLPAVEAAPQAPTVRMKVGTQHVPDMEYLKVLAAFGVTHACSDLPSTRLDEKWSVESLKQLRDQYHSAGVDLEMVPLPLSSHPIESAEMPDLLLGKNPGRERDIDAICQMVRNVSLAGIPSAKYNLNLLGVVRTADTTGRGGAHYSTFHYGEADQSKPTAAGPVPADLYWERITHFLDRVIPVANEYKVRMACHPHDPGMPTGKGYRGVETVLGSVDGLKRFLSIKESPYHGLNFCQGTISEMLQNPSTDILPVIRWFGSRGKIFNVHFRNIEGKFLDFRETLPDNGDVDMPRALRAYQEVGYDGMLMPDHVPKIDGDAGGKQAFAYCFGYIQALLQMLRAESKASPLNGG